MAEQSRLASYIEERIDANYLDDDNFSIEIKRFATRKHLKLII